MKIHAAAQMEGNVSYRMMSVIFSWSIFFHYSLILFFAASRLAALNDEEKGSLGGRYDACWEMGRSNELWLWYQMVSVDTWLDDGYVAARWRRGKKNSYQSQRPSGATVFHDFSKDVSYGESGRPVHSAFCSIRQANHIFQRFISLFLFFLISRACRR